MDFLSAADGFLFILINHLPHPTAANLVALTLSGVGSFGIIWFVISLLYFIREEKQDHMFFLPIITAVILSFAVSEYILKPLFIRPRPDLSVDAIIVDLINKGYSFPSGHAAVAFAGATVLSVYESRYRLWLYILAFLIAMSRIYLGKHYPSDIIIGAILGYLIGTLALIVHHPIIARSIGSGKRTYKHKAGRLKKH